MIKYYPFTTIEGIELLVSFPNYIGEATLYMNVEEKLVEITVSSHEYELGYGEYFLNLRNLNEYVEYGCPILDELGEIENLTYYTMIKLKPKYEARILDLLDQHAF